MGFLEGVCYTDPVKVLEQVKKGGVSELVHIKDHCAGENYKIDFVSRQFFVYDSEEEWWVKMPFGSKEAGLFFRQRPYM